MIAGRQHGIVSRWQMLEFGFAGSTIDRWVSAGHLHRLHRGVHAVGHTLINQEGRWLAAVLAVGPGGVLSHGPAGQLQRIIPRRERFALHVSLVANSDRSPAGIVTHRPRHLDPRDTTTRLGRAGYLVRRYSSGAMGSGEAVAHEVLAILAERLPAKWP